MSSICRGCLCVSTDNVSSVHSNLAEHFAFLIEQKNVSNEKFPLWFCWKCRYFLRKSIVFKDSCTRSNIILKNYLIKHKTDVQLANELLENEKKNLEPSILLKRSPIDITEYLINIVAENDSDAIEEESYENHTFCDIQNSKTIVNIENEEKLKNFTIVESVKKRKRRITNEDEGKKSIQAKNIKPNLQKNISNSPAKIFDLSLAVVTTLTVEQQVEELGKLRKSDDYVNAPFKCEPCAKGFSYEIVYEKHKEKHEAASGQYVCQLCTLHFSIKRNLTNHMNTHTNRYMCNICSKVLISKQSMMSHMYTEHNAAEQQVKCDLCEKVYKNRYSYAKHMRIHKKSKEHKCHLCHKVFLWKDNLNRHLTNHKKEKPFSCKMCPKSFSLKQNLKDHLKAHLNVTHIDTMSIDDKTFYCVECDLSYTTQAKLNHHLKRGTRHLQPEQFKFVCKFCDKRYVNNFQLSTHIDRDHLNKRSQVCQFCDAAFVSSRTLQAHIKSVHEGYRKPRTHICEVCSKGFPDKRILQAHLRTHTGERPYSCQYCSATFAHSGAKYTHIKLVHLKIKKNSIKKFSGVKNTEKNISVNDLSNVEKVNGSSSVNLLSLDKSKEIKTEPTNKRRI